MKFAYLIQLTVICGLVAAHPGGHKRMPAHELHRRQFAARYRHIQARTCAPAIAAYQANRKAKRAALKKRQNQNGNQQISGSNGQPLSGTPSNHTAHGSPTPQILLGSSTSSAALPHYTSIQNFTCVTAPEVTEGPYYINNELVRQDLTETQGGIKLVLDIGVLDVTTCEPLSDAFVEIWGANATGVYSSYASTLDGGSGPDNTSMTAPPGTASITGTSIPFSVPSGSGSGPDNTSMTAPSDIASMTGTSIPLSAPSGSATGGGGAGMASSTLERNETFGRGGYATDTNGIVELTTIYPGYYASRTAHIHTMVHLNWEESSNGTLISHAGNVLHIGQFFFNETWNDAVYAVSPYTNDTNERTYNDEDSILAEENADGNNAYIELELLGDDISEGILGYVTMGINSSASYTITNTNYLNSSDSATASAPSSSILSASVSV